MSAPEPSCLPIQSVGELDPRPVEWLWPGRLALGRLALLEGDPGLGKSFIALDLAARLSAGRPWPDGTPGPGPLPALVIAAEDNSRDTLRPRLQTLGADLSRVFYSAGDDPLAGPPLRLPRQAKALDGPSPAPAPGWWCSTRWPSSSTAAFPSTTRRACAGCCPRWRGSPRRAAVSWCWSAT
jgi:hypothetical protein